ncbi:hypothetical protein CK203_063864 [Vitis vinifera]|uniref:Retrotransposon gag domain-containing protein n=1 Tax=Vitis vinifera TaxID=29760 RepID=A0A438G2V5_VITVI|nr:hypothetical protein CK203_063864 [Vitis vinifera]
MPTLGKLLDSKETSISYLLRACEGKSKVKITLNGNASLNIMEATPEDQHSHHGHQDNPNAFRSMRDRMHPPRMSAPSCIVPPTEQLVIDRILFHFYQLSMDGKPRSIRTWTDLQAEFLKKFFPTHRTNGLKRQISNFSAKENEKFYECWERYMEAINACPHHAEVSRGWDEPTKEKWEDEVSTKCFNAKAGMYTLNEDIDMKAKVAAMTRRLEELELKKIHEVQAVAETPVQVKPCPICQSYEHLVEECPTIPAARKCLEIKQMSLDNSSPQQCFVWKYLQLNWRNHPNFSWKPRAPQYTSQLNHLNKLQS